MPGRRITGDGGSKRIGGGRKEHEFSRKNYGRGKFAVGPLATKICRTLSEERGGGKQNRKKIPDNPTKGVSSNRQKIGPAEKVPGKYPLRTGGI